MRRASREALSIERTSAILVGCLRYFTYIPALHVMSLSCQDFCQLVCCPRLKWKAGKSLGQGKKASRLTPPLPSHQHHLPPGAHHQHHLSIASFTRVIVALTERRAHHRHFVIDVWSRDRTSRNTPTQEQDLVLRLPAHTPFCAHIQCVRQNRALAVKLVRTCAELCAASPASTRKQR